MHFSHFPTSSHLGTSWVASTACKGIKMAQWGPSPAPSWSSGGSHPAPQICGCHKWNTNHTAHYWPLLLGLFHPLFYFMKVGTLPQPFPAPVSLLSPASNPDSPWLSFGCWDIFKNIFVFFYSSSQINFWFLPWPLWIGRQSTGWHKAVTPLSILCLSLFLSSACLLIWVLPRDYFTDASLTKNPPGLFTMDTILRTW